MSKNFRNKQNKPVNPTKTPANAIGSKVSEGVYITKEQNEEYQLLKSPNEQAIKEYRGGKVEQVDEEIRQTRAKKLKDLDDWIEDQRITREKELKDNLKSLNESLKSTKNEINEAEEKAKAVIKEAEEKSKFETADYLKKLDLRDNELRTKEIELVKSSVELDARDKVFDLRTSKLVTLENIYMKANPEMLSTLENQIKSKELYIEDIREKYEKLQNKLNEVDTFKLIVNGRSPETLLKENEELKDQILKLEDKCNRYSEFELIEMDRALDEAPNLRKEIDDKSRDLSNKTSELNRLKNNLLELEQVRAQCDLLRTLNDHLRKELETSKRALESRVGEVCPALTEVDVEETDKQGIPKEQYDRRQALKLTTSKRPITLNSIVTHVVDFAASQDVPLFYEDRDIRAFLAGLASSKLVILQGLSGTGKTSLPKVFIDALFGERKIVPVESSWRDRNELLGYYNDFNRKFTAKDFTCHLYRAGLPNYADTPFFILLDEMNLSRVEYYFSDFLSVLDDEMQKWQIKLVDTDLRNLPSELPDAVVKYIEHDDDDRTKELYAKLYNKKTTELLNDKISEKEKAEFIRFLSDYSKNNKLQDNLLNGPQNLINGNTIKIPENVWFIGTANRDESTFEISDKVYDRAQVLNFNTRGQGKQRRTTEPLYINYGRMKKLFAEANDQYPFKSHENKLVEKINKFLVDKFNVDYGNRIEMQMDKFVPVYIAAGMTDGPKKDVTKNDLESEAIDYQLTNKVLRKIEYKQVSKENLEELKQLLEHEHLSKGVKLIEEKIQKDNWV